MAVLWVVGTAEAVAGGKITVMTRNLYLGADLAPILTATTETDFFVSAAAVLGQIAATNFPERAEALAAEIAEKQPHLVGLQEVVNLTLDGTHGLPPFRDYLADLLDALAAQGANYVVAAIVENLTLVLTIPGIGTVGVTDRDVILARSDVSFSVPLNESACPQRFSVSGCNYLAFVSGTAPVVGTVDLKRGFVIVDALVDGSPFRVANTHLEGRDPVPTNPLSQIFQDAQASELILALAAVPNPLGGPVFVVGDINSSPDDPVITIGPLTIVPPYRQFLAAGYTDAWTLRPGKPPGFTCCQLGDLSNRESVLSERIDIVFSDAIPVRVKANVVGNDESDKTTPSGLWPSDHAGVVARLEFGP
jgi:endonuclease/exonuclease/phosphatase family metal-dependent hydrolase